MAAAAPPIKVNLGFQEEDNNVILADDIPRTSCKKIDSYFRTLFGKVHVEIAAQWIAIANLIFQLALNSDFRLVFPSTEPNMRMVMSERYMYAINISVLVCVLVAKYKRIGRLYWPFLAYYGLITAICAAVLGHSAFKIYCDLSGSCSRFYWTQRPFKGSIIVFVMLVELLLVCWMEMVVYKAYKYMIYSRNGNSANNQYQSNISKQNKVFSQVPVKV